MRPVTYDITFVRLQPGLTLLESLEERAARYDPEAEPERMHLTEQQRAVWDRIVQRITLELGPVTCEEYLYSLTLCRDGPAGYLQLDYNGQSADIEIPYRYPDASALPIITEAYRIAAIVEQESGLTGFDGQTDQATATGDITHAAAKLGSVARWAQDNLTQHIPPVSDPADR